MTPPDRDALAAQIIEFIRSPESGIGPVRRQDFDSDWRKSGVYAVLDCVFSSMADFRSVVEPTLERFAERSGMVDQPDLTFTQFCDYVRDGQGHEPSQERFEQVAAEVFGNRQKIAGRTKVEVAYDVCQVFAHRGLETKADLRNLAALPVTEETSGAANELERLVMDVIVGGDPGNGKVRGMGLALGTYLLICLGETAFIKPDTLLLRRVGRLGGWEPRAGNLADYTLVREAITLAAREFGTVPAHIDHLLWKAESDRAKSSAVS